MRPVAPPPHPDPQPGAADRAAPAGPIDPARLRQRTWWSTVGVVYGVGAYLLVSIVVTERSLPVAVLAALGSIVATIASARVLQRRLPGTTNDPQDPRDQASAGLAALAAVGAIAALAAAQWADTVVGALAPGVATAAAAVRVPSRWRGTAVAAGGAMTLAVVLATQQIAGMQVDRATAANQGLLALLVAGGLVVARWFWQLVHRLEQARRLEADLAVADERLRFAADLHDVQGHHLQVIALQSELATRLAATDPDGAAAQMAQVHEHARTALADTREVVHGYRRTPLGDELANATRVLDAAGIDGRLDHGTTSHAAAVGEPGRQLLGLVVREATTNILRHSEARRARLALDIDDTIAHLAIHNDGATATTDQGPGTGLAGLAERLAEAGGRLQWQQQDGWFTVTARVPISADDSA